MSAAEAEKKLRAALKVEELEPGKFRIGKVTFDRNARTVTFPAKVNMRGGLIEYVLWECCYCWIAVRRNAQPRVAARCRLPYSSAFTQIKLAPSPHPLSL